MSIFGKIMSSVFGKAEASTAPQTGTTPSGTPAGAPSHGGGTTTATVPTGAGGQVDVGEILTKMAAQNRENLDWRHSIVDLMKLLDLDSSLSARKELAKELHYSGDVSDSASMNVWLHTQVMHKLAENGGKVPEELLKHA